jgi:hypothetical protein
LFSFPKESVDAKAIVLGHTLGGEMDSGELLRDITDD